MRRQNSNFYRYGIKRNWKLNLKTKNINDNLFLWFFFLKKVIAVLAYKVFSFKRELTKPRFIFDLFKYNNYKSDLIINKKTKKLKKIKKTKKTKRRRTFFFKGKVRVKEKKSFFFSFLVLAERRHKFIGILNINRLLFRKIMLRILRVNRRKRYNKLRYRNRKKNFYKNFFFYYYKRRQFFFRRWYKKIIILRNNCRNTFFLKKKKVFFLQNNNIFSKKKFLIVLFNYLVIYFLKKNLKYIFFNKLLKSNYNFLKKKKLLKRRVRRFIFKKSITNYKKYLFKKKLSIAIYFRKWFSIYFKKRTFLYRHKIKYFCSLYLDNYLFENYNIIPAIDYNNNLYAPKNNFNIRLFNHFFKVIIGSYFFKKNIFLYNTISYCLIYKDVDLLYFFFKREFEGSKFQYRFLFFFLRVIWRIFFISHKSVGFCLKVTGRLYKWKRARARVFKGIGFANKHALGINDVKSDIYFIKGFIFGYTGHIGFSFWLL